MFRGLTFLGHSVESIGNVLYSVLQEGTTMYDRRRQDRQLHWSHCLHSSAMLTSGYNTDNDRQTRQYINDGANDEMGEEKCLELMASGKLQHVNDM